MLKISSTKKIYGVYVTKRTRKKGIFCKVNKVKFADVAQLAEQLTCNQQVTRSSRVIGFSKIKASNKTLEALILKNIPKRRLGYIISPETMRGT